MADYIVTILTATYNRKEQLTKLYKSLCAQTKKDFQWLVIDDGSSDDTEQYILSLKADDFLIEYHKKENGGKHTALNFSHPYIKGELVFMVDSDDYLEDFAVQCILEEWDNYNNRNDVGVLSFRKKMKNGEILSSEVVEPYIVDDITFRVNHSIKGDRSEVIRADLFVKYPLPEFKNEKFMGEGWLFRRIANRYDTVYFNDAIYTCDYLENGLSKSGRRLRMKCPYGMMENCKSFFVPRVRTIIKLKEMILYWVYAACAGYSFKKTIQTSGNIFGMIVTVIPGKILYIYWKNKYLKGESR